MVKMLKAWYEQERARHTGSNNQHDRALSFRDRPSNHYRRSSDMRVNLPVRQASIVGRICFNNLVIDAPSSNTLHTEIDQVIVSPYGIFCIEYKSHRGFIFGTAKQARWTQCSYSGNYAFYNPLRQNYKHVRALENLLQGTIRAPIHSFVVFTNATKVTVNSTSVFMGEAAMLSRVDNHTQQVYSLGEYRKIAETLAIASTRSPGLIDTHIREVNEYLAAVAA